MIIPQKGLSSPSKDRASTESLLETPEGLEAPPLRETALPVTRGSFLMRLSLGVGSSALTQAIGAVQAIAFVPFFLRAWGVDGYGRWLSLTALIANLSLLELGGQTYIGNLLAFHHARHEEEEFSRTLSEGLSLFLLLVLGVMLGCVLVLLGFAAFPVPGLGRPLHGEEARVLGFMAGVFLLAIAGGVYITAYRATGLFARGTMVGNAVRLLGILVSLVLLSLRVHPEIYAAGLLGTGMVGTAVVVWDTRRCIPGCRGLEINLRMAREGIRHLRGAVQFWLIALADTLSQQGLVLILAIYTSPAVVALYSTHRTLAMVSGYTGVLVQGPLWPEFSFLWAQNRLGDLRRGTYLAIKLILLVTGAGALFLWVGAPLLYPIWTRRELELYPTLLGLLLARGVLAAGWTTSAWGLMAANKHRPIVLYSLANGLLALGLAVVLIPRLGAIGLALAVVTADLVCGFATYPVLTARFLKVPTPSVYAQIGSAAFALVPAAVTAALIRRYLLGWWSLAALVLAGIVLSYPTLGLALGWAQAERAFAALRTLRTWRRRAALTEGKDSRETLLVGIVRIPQDTGSSLRKAGLGILNTVRLLEPARRVACEIHTLKQNRLSQEQVAEIYRVPYHEMAKYGKRVNPADCEWEPDDVLKLEHAKAIRAVLPRLTKVLVGGCSGGMAVLAFRQLGIDAWGFDLSPDLDRIVLPEVRDYVRWGSMTEIPFEASEGFDAFVTTDVLEHVQLRYIETMMAEIERIRAPWMAHLINHESRTADHMTLKPIRWWARRFARYHYIWRQDLKAPVHPNPRIYGLNGSPRNVFTFWEYRPCR